MGMRLFSYSVLRYVRDVVREEVLRSKKDARRIAESLAKFCGDVFEHFARRVLPTTAKHMRRSDDCFDAVISRHATECDRFIKVAWSVVDIWKAVVMDIDQRVSVYGERSAA